MAEPLELPGFVNAHSHTFQRALRGRAAGGDFWEWRDAMLDVAAGQSPAQVRSEYARTYAEMLRAGYTAVGEFHYLGLDEARAAAEAADEAGIALVLLYSAYGRDGLERFRQPSVDTYLEDVERLRGEGIVVGLAPHSVRACRREWLEEIARYADAERLVVHVHANEQPAEIEVCEREYGMRPIQLLAETGCLGPRTTVVHATHADELELNLLASAGARICVCPTTEANLGDGFPPFAGIVERAISLCVGSDSNVRIDPFEELRELEGTARRLSLRRNVFAPGALLRSGTDEGAAALGIAEWPRIEIDVEHPALAGVEREELLAALLFGCGSDVVAAPEHARLGL